MTYYGAIMWSPVPHGHEGRGARAIQAVSGLLNASMVSEWSYKIILKVLGWSSVPHSFKILQN